MLDYIHIKNFKTLKDNGFPLQALNIFSGLNGMGKSSVLQVLLLLRQSHEKNLLLKSGLMLKGEYLNLGTGADILSVDAPEEKFSFLMRWGEDDSILRFDFGYDSDADLQPTLNSKTGESFEINHIPLFNQSFQYISAERIGSKTYYERSDFHIKTLNTLGKQGEYTAHYLAEKYNLPLPLDSLKHSKSPSNDLLSNVEAWMSDITPGLKIRAEKKTDMDLVSLNYAFVQGKEITNNYKPQNVGFGLTYVLPVVTALLKAKKGELVLIENPESHLHPAGQSVLGRLAALAAAHGVQLLIETHSDHFLNGVRVAVKQGLIPSDQVALFFLDRDFSAEEHAAEVSQPVIDESGRIDIWPSGFFDEWENQLDHLL